MVLYERRLFIHVPLRRISGRGLSFDAGVFGNCGFAEDAEVGHDDC
jgi:hypothetical protein